ncbi:MAG: hypothetical protein JST50_21905 [Bacteroidetes bacterium]|jgi:hypothetical protein|nr:hypothetical protein [Bacteroidota bacterium]
MNGISDSSKLRQIHRDTNLKKINDSLVNRIKTLQKEKDNEINIKYINAVGGQWPLILIIVLVGIFLLYRKKIDKFLSRTKSIKGGVAGASIEIVQEDIIAKSNDESQLKTINSTSIDVEMEAEDKNITSTNISEEYSMFDVYKLIKDNKSNDAKIAFENIQSKITNQSEREENLSIYHYYRYIHGFTDAIVELEGIKQKSEIIITKVRIDYYIALCHEYSQQYELAISLALNALQEAKDSKLNDLKVQILLGISESFEKSGRWMDYISLCFGEMNDEIDFKSKFRLLKKIADLYYKNKRIFESIVCLLKANEFISNDKSLIFDLAYQLDEIDLEELSLQQYELRIKLGPDESNAINNLGVAYGKIGLKNKSMLQFFKAYEKGNSLAGSNLANNYLKVGFTEDAKQILNNIKSNFLDINSNVWKSFDQLEQNIKDEDSKNEQISKNSTLTKGFLEFFHKSLVESITLKTTLDFSGYLLKNNLHNVKMNESNLSLSIDFEDSEFSINFLSKTDLCGQCTGLNNSKLGKPIKYDQYNGYYAFYNGELRVFLQYKYYSTRQELIIYEFVKKIDEVKEEE